MEYDSDQTGGAQLLALQSKYLELWPREDELLYKFDLEMTVPWMTKDTA